MEYYAKTIINVLVGQHQVSAGLTAADVWVSIYAMSNCTSESYSLSVVWHNRLLNTTLFSIRLYWREKQWESQIQNDSCQPVFLPSFQTMDCSIQDLTNYQAVAEQVRKELSNDKNRFVPMEERRDTSVLSVHVLASLCHGKTCVIVNSY